MLHYNGTKVLGEFMSNDYAGLTLEQAASSARSQNNFNLIRLVAALSVIYGHSFVIAPTPGTDIFLQYVGHRFIGGVAVDIFFFISGFLVTASAMNRSSSLYFIACRILRIYPALFVCMLITTFILGPLVSTADKYWTIPTFQYFFLNSLTYQYILDLPGVFANNPIHEAVNGPIWTIFMEVRCYLVVAVVSTVGILKRRTLFNVLSASLIVIFYLNKNLPAPLQFYDYFHEQIVMMFIIGSFYWINRKFIFMNPWVLFCMLFIVGMAHGTDKFFYAYYLFVPYFVLMIAYMPGLQWFNRVGDYSYGVYLYGWPVAQTLMLFDPHMGAIENTILACTISLVLAILSWHLVESRMLRLKDSWPLNLLKDPPFGFTSLVRRQLGRFDVKIVSGKNLARTSAVLVFFVFLVFLVRHLESSSIEKLDLKITAIGPTVIQAGVNFNLQPDGQSAMWVACDSIPPKDTVIVFDGTPLQSATGGNVVTGEVPATLFKRSRDVLVLVQSNLSGKPLRSSPVTLHVKGPIEY